MEQLKRWREERAARQSRRLLGSDPSVTLPRRTSRMDRVKPASRRGFRFWPTPPPVSPVHPGWDDPTGGRLKRGLYISTIGHALLVPLVVLLANLDLGFHPKHDWISSNERSFGSVTLDRAPVAKTEKPNTKPDPPKPDPPKPEPPKPDPPKPQPEKVVAKPPKPVEKPDPNAVPTPVPDKKLAQAQERRTTETPAHERPSAQEPVTDPAASNGPLVAGTGPVAGSETSVGDVDGVDFPYNYYLELVRGKISQAWEVPQGMVARGRRIEAVVRFKIMRDGTVAENSIEVPSGQTIYDQSAVRAISMVRRFPPLPQEFGGAYLIVHFQFSFVGR